MLNVVRGNNGSNSIISGCTLSSCFSVMIKVSGIFANLISLPFFSFSFAVLMMMHTLYYIIYCSCVN